MTQTAWPSYTFGELAKRYHVSTRWLESVTSLSHDVPWDYDLVILDWDSSGGEFVLDVARDIRGTSGDINVLVIGYQEPSKAEMANWKGIIHGFSSKSLGVESVFNDAIKTYATEMSVMERKAISLAGR